MNYLLFQSAIPDQGNSETLPGSEHIHLLVSQLPASIELLDEPWPEDDFGWEFLTKYQKVYVSVLLQPETEGQWFITVSHLRLSDSKPNHGIEQAEEFLTQALENFIARDGRFSQVRRLTEEEFWTIPRNREIIEQFV